jgi:hypothetical protein
MIQGMRSDNAFTAPGTQAREKLASDPRALTRNSVKELVELAGTQGVELLMWIAMRGALRGSVVKAHSNYHIPISNTAAGLLVLEPVAGPVQSRHVEPLNPR